jgi:hypothetical protein
MTGKVTKAGVQNSDDATYRKKLMAASSGAGAQAKPGRPFVWSEKVSVLVRLAWYVNYRQQLVQVQLKIIRWQFIMAHIIIPQDSVLSGVMREPVINVDAQSCLRSIEPEFSF